MNLFRYMDALDLVEGARRGPKGLLDDEWFETYGGRQPGLPPGHDGTAAPLMPSPARDPFNNWYQARLRAALDETYARLQSRSPAAMPPWRATPGIWPAGRNGDEPSIFLLSANQSPINSVSGPPVLDRGDSAQPPIAPEGDALPPDQQPDYGYPWYDSDTSLAGPIAPSIVPPAPESLRGAPEADDASPRKPFRQLPNPSVDDRDLERAERKHRAIVKMWRESGRHTSADHLERFLNGDGSTLIISRDEARNFAPIRNAEQKNDRRFERAFLADGESGYAERLAKLKDGQTIELKDDFKVDYGPGSFVLQALDPDTTDFATSFGRFGLRSDAPKIKATRRGDTIEIEAMVNHHFDDRYDFNPGQPYASEPNLLERKGKARSYDRKASWNRHLTGTIRIDNGRLHSPKFKWEDVDP
jgi:hypothetical protein